jgi:hypothetical protein
MRISRIHHLKPAFVLAVAGILSSLPAAADSNTNAVIGMLGLGCKNRVLEEFGVPNSDITVQLGATLQQDLDSGSMTAEDLKKLGASFSWEVSDKNASGYCNVDGNGEITEFVQW